MGVAKPSEQALKRIAKFSTKFGALDNEFCRHMYVLKEFAVHGETFFSS